MALGEKRMSFGASSGRSVVGFGAPFPSGDRDAVLDEHQTKVMPGKKPGKTPYVNTSWTVLGTAANEGGKDRKVFHSFHLNMKPGADGVLMCDRMGGLQDFVLATGNDFEPENSIHTDQEGKDLPCIDAEGVKEFVAQFAGNTFRVHIGIDKGDGKDFGPKNVISRFIYDASEQVEEAEQEEEQAEVVQIKKAAPKVAPKPQMKKASGTKKR